MTREAIADGYETCPATSVPAADISDRHPLDWRWQKLLASGVYSSVTEISDAEDIGKSHVSGKSDVSRILRPALLAPDMVKAILAGRADQTLILERLERPLPARWEEQRLAFRCAG